MFSLFLRKVSLLFILYLLILSFQFILFRTAFPDPTIIYLREGLGPEEREIIRRSFGLDRPIHEQYLLYILNFLRGDMGYSFLYKTPVRDIVLERLPNTLILTIPAVATAFVVSAVLGSYAAWRRGGLLDRLVVAVASVVNSLPLFWIGMIAIIVFSVQLGLLPPGGMRTPPYEAAGFLEKIASLDFLAHWVLPYTTLTLYMMSYPTLLMRSSMITTLGEDFVEAYRAIGLDEKKIVREARRYSIIPLVTQMGVSLGLSFAGSVAFETVFSWPGIGRELVIAFNNLDYPLAQGIFAVMSLAVLVINTVVDLTYSYLDPRTRRGT